MKARMLLAAPLLVFPLLLAGCGKKENPVASAWDSVLDGLDMRENEKFKDAAEDAADAAREAGEAIKEKAEEAREALSQ